MSLDALAPDQRAVVQLVLQQDRSYDELAAILARLLELDGCDGQWRWQRVGELLYGRRSHPERHNPALRAWLVLLERGLWQLGLSAPARSVNKSRNRTRANAAPPKGGRGLLHLERLNRSSATVRLDPAFAAELRAATSELPAHVFRLRLEDRPNPEGNLPTRATRARARLGAALACWAHQPPGPEGLNARLNDVLERYGGVDIDRVARRRHLAQWADDLLEHLVAAASQLGAGLARLPARAGRVVDTVVRLGRARPPQPASAPTAPTVPPRAPPLRV